MCFLDRVLYFDRSVGWFKFITKTWFKTSFPVSYVFFHCNNYTFYLVFSVLSLSLSPPSECFSMLDACTLICDMTILITLFQTIEALSIVPTPELALRLYLQCAEVCHDCVIVQIKGSENDFGFLPSIFVGKHFLLSRLAVKA